MGAMMNPTRADRSGTASVLMVPGFPAASARSEPKAKPQRGQVLVLLVMSIFVLLGLVALVIDVSWYWSNNLRVQRAADAAALAGRCRLCRSRVHWAPTPWAPAPETHTRRRPRTAIRTALAG